MSKLLLVIALFALLAASVQGYSSPSLVEVDADSSLSVEASAEAAIDRDLAVLNEGQTAEEAAEEEQANQQTLAELHAITNVDDVLMEEEASIPEVADAELVEISQDPSVTAAAPAAPANPTYVLPYPPVLPGHYTPLFNPYTNVNPLSTPFANYAAQPGAHPGVAAAAAAQAAGLAAINGQIAGAAVGAAGAYPYYPFAARAAGVAAQLAGNPVPFSGYAGWIHPQNLNSAGVGDNQPSDFPAAFVEVATEEAETVGCNNCVFN